MKYENPKIRYCRKHLRISGKRRGDESVKVEATQFLRIIILLPDSKESQSIEKNSAGSPITFDFYVFSIAFSSIMVLQPREGIISGLTDAVVVSAKRLFFGLFEPLPSLSDILLKGKSENSFRISKS